MKKQPIESVVHDWIAELPFTQQAVLMLTLRGPDGLPKVCSTKALLFYIRGVVLKPAYPGLENVGEYIPDSFMRIDFENFDATSAQYFNSVDEYPHHFIMHLVHAAEIIGYNHPNEFWAGKFLHFYKYACKSLHMTPETKEELFKRLKK